jgi:hypothetical protein
VGGCAQRCDRLHAVKSIRELSGHFDRYRSGHCGDGGELGPVPQRMVHIGCQAPLPRLRLHLLRRLLLTQARSAAARLGSPGTVPKADPNEP